jgi:hypothetical protein
MSDYEKELEITVEILRDKLQATLERQERLEKNLNASLYDVKALLGQMGDCIGKLKRLDEADYGSEVEKVLTSFKKDKKVIEKELLSKHDAIHDRIINLLDRFKE